MSRWRHAFYKLVPSWLSTGQGELVLYSLGRLTDGFIERARRSLTARFPTYSGPTGLALLGDERGILKGRNESLTGYARRLRGWRGPNGHQVRGTPFAVLFQIWNYFGGLESQSLDNAGNVYTIAADGTRTASHGGSWDWDGDASWWRFWLLLKPPSGMSFSVQTAGGADVPGAALGMSGMSAGDADTVRRLFTGAHPWKPAGTKAEWLIVDDTGDPVPPTPDGTWGNWSKNQAGTQIPARPDGLRFVALRSANLDYAGDPTNYPTLITIGPSDSNPATHTYAGNAASFPDSINMPDESTYDGDPTNFPDTIRLTDDGKAMTT